MKICILIATCLLMLCPISVQATGLDETITEEVTEEVTEEFTNSEEQTTLEDDESYPEDESVAADEEASDGLSLFGFYTEPQDVSYILTKIYNLLLMFVYIYIIDTGRKIVIRVLQKGQV